MARTLILLSLSLLLPACGDQSVASNAAVPDLNVMSETPGDWSDVRLLEGRTPAESGLFEDSPVTVDLNALVGEDVQAFRRAMATAGPIVRAGPVLWTASRDGSAYLLIYPDDHAIEAGLKRRGVWEVFRTPGAEVPVPAPVTALLER